jgi:hypothetical protein
VTIEVTPIKEERRMAGEAIFIGWGAPVRGREAKGLEVFGEAVELWGRLQQDGRIESFEPVLLGPHGGDLQGFFLLRGGRARLDELVRSEEFERVATRAGFIVESFGVVPAYCGEGIQRPMATYQQAATELGG